MTGARAGRVGPVPVAIAACVLATLAAVPIFATEQLRALVFLNTRWPVPTGAFPVGRSTFTSGTDPPIDLWYPARTADVGLGDRAGAFVQALLRPTQAGAFRDVAPADSSRYPLVVLLPSWFSRRHENTFLAANLASHGFVVAAVDDFIHGAPLLGEDRTAQVASLDFASDVAFKASRKLSARRAVLGAKMVVATIDAVLAHPWLGIHIDASRVGVLGFSFGGSIAAAMSRETGRLRAVVNLDGDVIETESWPPAMPYLFLTSDLPYPTAADLTLENLAFRFESITTRDTYDLHMHPDIPPTCSALSVKGAVHTDFSDRVVVPSFRNLWTARAPDRMALWSDINRVIVAFLSAHLGDPATHAMPRDALPIDALPMDALPMDALPMRFVKLPSR